MARPSGTGGRPTKQRRKRITPKRRNAPKAMRNRGASIAGQETVVARLTQERDEALLRETANAEILRLIAKSSGDLELLFRTILENATRICNANFGTLFRFDGENFFPAAQFNTPTALLKAQTRRGPFKPTPGTAMEHVLRTKQVSHSADKVTEPVPGFFAKYGGARSQVTVPMLKDDLLIGVIGIYHQEVRPFTDKQIELLQNFASQAVIAIENARLLNELRRRTDDLSEALEQQTATSEVLKVISSSPGELKPVFETMLAYAVRICGAKFGTLFLCEGDDFRVVAEHNTPPALVELHQREPTIRVGPSTSLYRSKKAKQPIQIADLTAEPAYFERDPNRVALVELGGYRGVLSVPMVKEGEVIGAINMYRQDAGTFSDNQVELVKNFAAQAVIAIENARLLNELRQRTDDLTESLEQQTATSDVLQVISSSQGKLEPVFQKMLEKATHVCGANFGTMNLWDGESVNIAASYNVPPAFAAWRQRTPIRPHAESGLALAIRTHHAAHVHDLRYGPAYLARDPANVAMVEIAGARTIVTVPMLKEDKVIGTMSIFRQEVRPFTDKQIALVENFTKQAVIAIENMRLLNELRQRTDDLSEALERQTATSEVLRVISSSPGELEPVFQAMLENATRLCEANFGILFVGEGNVFRSVAVHSPPSAYTDWYEHHPFFNVKDHPQSLLARLAESREIIHIADLRLDPSYAARVPILVAFVDNAGARTVLVVPMVKEDKLIGAIVIYRTEVRPFSEKQIELVQNFAAQAVIAIENSRLLSELRESYRLVQEQASKLETQSQELVKLNQQLEQRVADQVGEIERMGRLRRFLPPQVADLIVASGTEKQLESHRREITALFCDLRGFTGFSEASAPEDVMALLRDYHAAIGEIIIKYSGTLERYAGDGVMVVFNDPVPVDNPALRAVLMALETREAMGALMEKWRQLGHDVGFGIGIAHGFATLGTIGFEGRFDYAAIGTVSNVSSRLCDEAKPGQILISPRVFTAVKDAVTVEPVGEFALKGIGRPLTAYNVLGVRPAN
jgi:GAF domain-containing protein